MTRLLSTIELDTQSLPGVIHAACVLEAAACKPGNVHPQAAFADLSFADFVTSAAVIAPILADAQQRGVTPTILEAVRATQEAVGKNTNLGIILLLAPLASVPCGTPLRPLLMHDVITRLTVSDSERLYEAIRQAHPGGMGAVSEQDLLESPTLPPRDLMLLAAERDQIAALWVDGFEDLLEWGVPTFLNWQRRAGHWELGIIGTQLAWLERYGDTLIERKLGLELGEQVRRGARAVLDAGWPEWNRGWHALREFDAWLRGDGHRRNPGTTADIMAAILFVVLREQLWVPPEECPSFDMGSTGIDHASV